MKSESETKILNAIKNALKPHGNIDLIQWAKYNCPVVNSPKGSHIDFELTPYFKEPYREIMTNPNLKECSICSPVGAGKSTLVIGLITTCVALYPKEIMYVAQSEDMTTSFFDILLKPAMRKNKNILKMWPKKAQDKRGEIHFPTCSIYTGFATAINTLQSKSIDLQLLDECWMFEKEGVIEEARQRLHNRPSSRMVMVSQGGRIGDQFHRSYSLGQIKKYAWECPSCKSRNIYKFDDLKFDYTKEDDGTPIWATVYAQLECPCCNHRVEDTIEDRRKLSENAIYIVEDPNQNYLPGNVSYNFNQMAVYDVAWSDLVREFLKANSSNLRRTALRQFEQKKMGIFYDEAKNVETIDLDSVDGGYSMDDYKFDRWDVRLMTVDVQADRMYVCIRDWSREGASRLVAYKYASTFADLEKIRIEYNIKPKEVFIDSAYRAEEVKKAGAQYGWIGCNGLKDSLFKVKNENGKTVMRVYDDPTNYEVMTNNGKKRFQVVNYAGTSVKDILATIQNNTRHTWLIPSGGENHAMYLHQLQSEVREIKTATGKPYYRKLRDQNHAYDTEVQQIVGAMIWKCLVYQEDEVSE